MAKKALPTTPTRLELPGGAVDALVHGGSRGAVRLRIVEGVLHIQTPSGTLREAQQLLQQKAGWILKHCRQQSRAQDIATHYRQHLDRNAHVLGRPRQLVFEAAPATRYRLQGDVFYIYAPQKHLHRRAELAAFALRKLAENYLTRRTVELAQLTGDAVNSIRVKGHRSKWGSCSSKRNINLNWHLILMSKDVIDYVIIHELMHLREMNHGPRFWAHVASYYPDYKEAINALKEEQWKIGIYD